MPKGREFTNRGDPRREPEPTPAYHKAAQFVGEQPAGEAYFTMQELIFATTEDLSVFRLMLDRIWHVAVLGEPPSDEVDQQLTAILTVAGELTSLPSQVLTFLADRRTQLHRLGPRVEGHYRPGKRFKL